jgi:hypothetical protein
MRTLIAIAVALTGLSAVPALAQSIGGRDGTTNVISDRIGMPGATSDPMSQYQNQRALNNLPAQESRALDSKLGPARPARAGELAAGTTVNDKTGVVIAKIDQIVPDGVVLSSNSGKLKIPANAFGHNKAGLLLDMTKAEFDAIVSKANAAS